MHQRVPRCGLWQHLNGRHRLLRVYLRQLPAASQAAALHYEAEGFVYIPRGLEFPFNQCRQVWELIHCEERWSSRKAGLKQSRVMLGQLSKVDTAYPQVCKRSLSKSFCGAFKIQCIVDELESLPEIRAIEVTSILIFFAVVSEDCRRQARVAYSFRSIMELHISDCTQTGRDSPIKEAVL